MKKLFTVFAIGFFIFGLTVAANAVPVTFFGEDLGGGENARLTSWPNSLNAQTSFYNNLNGISTEDFESMSGNVADFGGGLTATLTGGSRAYQGSGTNGYGRYPISGNYYWEATDNFTLNFSEAISAFGFYGVDIGDFNGQVVLGLNNGGTTTLNIGNSTNILGGSVCYFGFYDLDETFTSIRFSNTNAGTDVFAFDDFTIGTIENVDPVDPSIAPVPEPATILLLGTGLAGLAGFRKKIKKA